MEYYITTPADYWIAQNAVSITLNALGDKNRIQGSVASGSVIMCFVESIKAENAGGEQGNGEGLWYGSNHEPKRWPLSLSPTYFNSDTHKYVYVAIPRSASVGSQAIIVFPSEQLDIYGRAIRSSDDSSDDSSDGVEDTYIQVGSTNYFYVWLNGIISAPRFNPETNKEERAWEDPIGDREWGLLETAQGREEQFSSGEWYSWSAVNQTVTFLKKIVMSPASWFQNLIIGSGTTQGNLNGVAKQGITTEQNGWDSHIVTPEYLDEFGNTRYLRKDQDDSTPYTLTMGGADVTGDASVGGDLTVSGNTSVGGDLDVAGDTALSGNTIFGSVHFTPDSMGYGYVENQGGHFLQVENLKVLGKMEAKEVEIQEVNYVGGSIVLTPANGFTVIGVEAYDYEDKLIEDTSRYADDAVKFKLFFNNEDEDGVKIKNTWRFGDLAYCERWDLKAGNQQNFQTHRWWRKVLMFEHLEQVNGGWQASEVQSDSDADYIFVSNVCDENAQEMEYGARNVSIPAVGDKVVMLGNIHKNNGGEYDQVDRRTAIILSASQLGAPYIRMYKNVPIENVTAPYFRMSTPFINLSHDETNIEADSIKIHGPNNTLINVAQSLGKLDNKFEIWQADDDTTPTLNTEPASLWTVAEYAEHVGDFLILTDGRCFEFKVNSGVYSWEPVTDEYLIAFIHKIDTKSTTFNGEDFESNQIPEGYRANDTWVNCKYNDGEHNYVGEILIAIRNQDGLADIEDWTTTNNYKTYLSSYMDEINTIVAKYGIQTDGKHVSWFFDDYDDIDGDLVDEHNVPTSLAQLWAYEDGVGRVGVEESEDVRKSHLGDLAYITDREQDPTKKDTLWEYTRTIVTIEGTETYTYGWVSSDDNITKQILAKANATEAAVDGKINTYFYSPSPNEPTDYSVGDFLIIGSNNGNAYTFNGGAKSYKNESLVCIQDYSGSFNISDWKPMGDYPTREDVNDMIAQYTTDAGFWKRDNYATLFAAAYLEGVLLDGASVTPLVVYDQAAGAWKSLLSLDADKIIVTGTTQFFRRAQDSNLLGTLATKNYIEQSDLESALGEIVSSISDKAVPQDIIDALETYNSTIIDGNYIRTGLIDVGAIKTLLINAEHILGNDAVFTGRLEAQSGYFYGYLRSNFEDANEVEGQAQGNTTIYLSGNHCNLIVHRGFHYKLPCNNAQVGKRIILVDPQSQQQSGNVTVSSDNNSGIVGFLGNDVNTSATQNPTQLSFTNGLMEFVCARFGNNNICWVLVSNQTAWSKSNVSLFRGVKRVPMLLVYGQVGVDGQNRLNYSEYYIAEGVTTHYLKGTDNGLYKLGIYIEGATMDNIINRLIVTVMGYGTRGNSNVLATIESIERPTEGDFRYYNIRTFTLVGKVHETFLFRIEYLG